MRKKDFITRLVVIYQNLFILYFNAKGKKIRSFHRLSMTFLGAIFFLDSMKMKNVSYVILPRNLAIEIYDDIYNIP